MLMAMMSWILAVVETLGYSDWPVALGEDALTFVCTVLSLRVIAS